MNVAQPESDSDNQQFVPEDLDTHKLLLGLKRARLAEDFKTYDYFFGIIVERYWLLLLKIALNTDATHQYIMFEDALDIVQGTFLKIHESIQDYREIEKGGTRWLLTICRHLAIDLIRQMGSKQAVSLEAQSEDMFVQDSDASLEFEKVLSQQIVDDSILALSDEEYMQLFIIGKNRGTPRTTYVNASKHLIDEIRKRQERDTP